MPLLHAIDLNRAVAFGRRVARDGIDNAIGSPWMLDFRYTVLRESMLDPEFSEVISSMGAVERGHMIAYAFLGAAKELCDFMDGRTKDAR